MFVLSNRYTYNLSTLLEVLRKLLLICAKVHILDEDTTWFYIVLVKLLGLVHGLWF